MLISMTLTIALATPRGPAIEGPEARAVAYLAAPGA